jgi:hypothetical protein
MVRARETPVRLHRDRPDLYLAEPRDLLDHVPSPLESRDRSDLLRVLQWGRDFLCQVHPDLGRSGAVCPYVPPALDKNLLWLASQPGLTGRSAIRQVIREYGDWFLQLEPTAWPTARFKAFIIVFPDVTAEDAPDVIDVVQRELKPEFVSRGLMLGEFHPDCPSPGVRNPGFRPLQSPIPLLVIRHMLPMDFLFLDGEARFVTAYLDRFEHEVPSSLSPRLAQAMLRFGLESPPRQEPGAGGLTAVPGTTP